MSNTKDLQTSEKPTTERILSFDLMRGYFLLVILVNHLAYYPSGLTPLTGRGFLYASTAEGFFAVSGIILGIVRGRKLLSQPFKVAAKLLWKRSLQLYIASIVLTLLFTLVGQFFLQNTGLKFGIYTDWTNWWNLIWQTVTLSYSYGWADFLRFYALFLFVAPAALWFIRKGYWYVVITVSLIVWSLYPLLPTGVEAFQPISWQPIFFISFVIGYYWQDIIAWWRNLFTPRVRSLIKLGWFLVFIVTLVTSFILVFGFTLESETGAKLQARHVEIEQHFLKDRMPIERMLLGTVWFWGIFILFRRFEGLIKKWVGWLLYEFGTHSLYVYTVSAFVIFFMHLWIPAPGVENRIGNFLLSMLGLAIVWLALKTKFLAKVIPR